MPKPLHRVVRVVAVALAGCLAIAMTRGDTPGDGGAPRRGDRFRNNYVEFEPKGLGALRGHTALARVDVNHPRGAMPLKAWSMR